MLLAEACISSLNFHLNHFLAFTRGDPGQLEEKLHLIA
jgi:hypothetical protein